MKNKALKIVLDAVASVVVFGVTAVLAAEILSLVLGTTKDASGQEKVHGGYAVTIAVFVVCLVVTVVFARMFYKFLSRYKITKATEQ